MESLCTLLNDRYRYMNHNLVNQCQYKPNQIDYWKTYKNDAVNARIRSNVHSNGRREREGDREGRRQPN